MHIEDLIPAPPPFVPLPKSLVEKLAEKEGGLLGLFQLIDPDEILDFLESTGDLP